MPRLIRPRGLPAERRHDDRRRVRPDGVGCDDCQSEDRHRQDQREHEQERHSQACQALSHVQPARFDKLVTPPRTGRGTYSRDWVAAQAAPKLDKEGACLAQALYFEARGEEVTGIFAVAEVILNRVDSPAYPDTICGVVNQGTGRLHQCQFSYTCDGRKETIGEPRAYDFVARVAALTMAAEDRPLTDGATHYHTKSVNPRWARKFPRTATIGVHHFYRQPGSGAES